MPIEVNYIDDGKGVEILATEVVTGKELIAAQHKIYAPDKLAAQQYHIIDKSQCTEYDVTAVDIQIMSEMDRKAAKINPGIIMAIIESSSLQFSLSEVWQAYVESFVQHCQSFSNRHDALEWIEQARQQKQA